jgi:predicted dehydrogenase
VEKPIASSSAESEQFAANPMIMVGHCERFNPAFQRLEAPNTGELVVRRLTPVSRLSGAVDVVLDLMVHDLDLLLNIGGSIEDIRIVERAMGSQGLDHLRLLARTQTGLLADLTASRIHDGADRSWRYPEIGLDFDLLAGEVYRDGYVLGSEGREDALKLQWRAFMQAVSGGRSPIASAQAGHLAVLAAERVRLLAMGKSHARAS